MEWFYLIALLISIAGLLVCDWRWKLAFWKDARRTGLAIAAGMVVFVIWDLVGIHLGIFFHGGGQYALPFRILPEFPIEEIFFLFLLCYVALLLYLGAKRWRRTS